jgi:sporulation protein YlmC with PRC-barrel domain
MRVDLHAKVLTRDGEHVGSVQRAVVNPKMNEVTELVISTGAILGRDLLLPRREIDRASRDGDAIRLDLTRAEVERLPEYVPAGYLVPPAAWVPPAGYAFGAYGGFVWPLTYAELAEQDGAARPGSTDEPSIGKGATVFDRDGDDLGVVEDVLFERESGRLRGFVLRVGGVFRTLFGGGETVEVGRDAIERVAENAVYLRLPKEALERSQRRRPARRSAR